MIGFKFKQLVELRKSGSRTPDMIGFKFKHLVKLGKSVN